MVCSIPDKILGFDTDEIFAYNTGKVVWVRDRYIGCLYLSLVTCALSWVLVGEILWRNEHFQMKDVNGIPRMWFSRPTKGMCDPNVPTCKSNFKPTAELPYCAQYRGTGPVSHRSTCHYADKHTLFPHGSEPNQAFIPTSFVVVTEREGCDKDGSEVCENEYEKEGDGGYYLSDSELTYYANIEDFVVQLTSSYDRETISGTSLDHHGFYMECLDARGLQEKNWTDRMGKERECQNEKLVAIECLTGSDCSRAKKPKERGKGFFPKELDAMGSAITDDSLSLSGARARAMQRRTRARAGLVELDRRPETQQTSEDTKVPDVFAGSWGDSFRLGKILELAGADLDRDYNMDKLTTRKAGTIIQIEIEYSNLRRILSTFGLSRVRYTYKFKEKKLPYMSREFMAIVQPSDYPTHRQYIVQHGILLVFTVKGEFGFFNIVHMLIVLTTTLTLVGTAHVMTDNLSIYLHPRKKNYFQLKYEVSPDFSEMWKCPKCGFCNSPKTQHCRGIPEWTSAEDEGVEFCGEERPSPPSPKPPSPPSQ
jgi:hypothetical protein